MDASESAVAGVDVDSQTRCAHYDDQTDVVAIRFACCGDHYACFECHEAVADHDPDVWPRAEFDRDAVLCGVCGTELTVREYLSAEFACPECDAAFNPGCRNHYHLYFER